MSRLEQAIITVVLTAILILVALIVFAANAQAPAPVPCMGSEERETLRKLSLDAIDQAYQEQVKHLFEIWVADNTEQPKRARVGTQNAISAHVRARNDALKWNPPLC